MADSQKLDVLKHLTSHLQSISGTFSTLVDENDDPLDFDLSDSVFRGRTIYGDSDPKTMLSILESPQGSFRVNAGENGEANKDNWVLLLQGWCPDDKENPSDPVYELLDAVEIRLGRIMKCTSYGEPKYPEEYRLGNTIVDLKFGPGVVRPPAEGVSSKTFFYLQLQVTLASVTG